MLTRTDGDNHTVTYGYDGVERVTSVKLPSGATYGFSYDDLGNRTGVTMPNGKTHTYGFSPTSDMTSYTAPGVAAMTRGHDDDHFASSIYAPGPRHDDVRPQDRRSPDRGGRRRVRLRRRDRPYQRGHTRGARRHVRLRRRPRHRGGRVHVRLRGGRAAGVGPARGHGKFGVSYDGDGFVTGYGPFTWEREAPLSGVSKIRTRRWRWR